MDILGSRETARGYIWKGENYKICILLQHKISYKKLVYVFRNSHKSLKGTVVHVITVGGALSEKIRTKVGSTPTYTTIINQ